MQLHKVFNKWWWGCALHLVFEILFFCLENREEVSQAESLFNLDVSSFVLAIDFTFRVSYLFIKRFLPPPLPPHSFNAKPLCSPSPLTPRYLSLCLSLFNSSTYTVCHYILFLFSSVLISLYWKENRRSPTHLYMQPVLLPPSPPLSPSLSLSLSVYFHI